MEEEGLWSREGLQGSESELGKEGRKVTGTEKWQGHWIRGVGEAGLLGGKRVSEMKERGAHTVV